MQGIHPVRVCNKTYLPKAVAHTESFNERNWTSIEEATGASYKVKVSLCLVCYKDWIIIVR